MSGSRLGWTTWLGGGPPRDRGDAGVRSDVDLMVIKAHIVNRHKGRVVARAGGKPGFKAVEDRRDHRPRAAPLSSHRSAILFPAILQDLECYAINCSPRPSITGLRRVRSMGDVHLAAHVRGEQTLQIFEGHSGGQ